MSAFRDRTPKIGSLATAGRAPFAVFRKSRFCLKLAWFWLKRKSRRAHENVVIFFRWLFPIPREHWVFKFSRDREREKKEKVSPTSYYYIPEEQWIEIRRHCEEVVRGNKKISWTSKGFVLVRKEE